MKYVQFPETEMGYHDEVALYFPELFNNKEGVDENSPNYEKVSCANVTFQVTDACNLACTYCYQHNKGIRAMSFETAKKFIDHILNGDAGFNKYINPELRPAIIIDFIGGEPFLQVDLIDKVIDYFRTETLKRDHPWASLYRINICSNGTLYNTPEVQRFLEKHNDHLSFAITLDGDKKLHDTCRIFPDGRGSFDLAYAAIKDWRSKGRYMGSKLTISPENLPYLSEAVIFMIEEGYKTIYANPVFESGWTEEHSRLYYQQMKIVSDYMHEHKLVDQVNVQLFKENSFRPMSPKDNSNYCGGAASGMLAVDPDGNIYPCLRYMESSLGSNQKPIIIGNVDRGLITTPEEKQCINCMACVNRRSQSTDECFNCPIADGCAWCSAFNYETFGTVNKRATYICGMHKAASLANAYHWNRYYREHNLPYCFKIYLPEEEALKIVSKEEFTLLKNLEEA